MLNLKNVEEILTREQLKQVIGGNGSGGGGYPGCIYIGKGGNHSCWYASSQATGSTLCQRVYGGNCDYENGPYHCNDYCIMN